jgi:uncharacterized protein YecT (DUF1311 family)
MRSNPVLRSAGLAAIFLLSAVFSASAQDELKCNPEGATSEMAQCARDDFDKADKKLNKVYQQLLKSFTETDKEVGDTTPEDSRVKRLKEAQRAWIVFRDADCALISTENFGGSMEQITIPGCTATVTEERTKQLEAILNPPEQ